ncbi:MAG: hypothetical protein AAGE94_05310 [Acidobacteriota bacterium]
MSGTLYTFDLGFNWNAPTIGSAFGYGTGLHPLQYGIINPNGSDPLWPTQFATSDSLRFHLTDITSGSDEDPLDVGDTVYIEDDAYTPYRTVTELSLIFGNPSSGAGAYPFTSTDPVFGTYSPRVGNSTLPGLVYGSTEIVFQSDRTDSAIYNAENADWKVARWYVGSSSGMQFVDTPCFSEMSVRLTATYEGVTKYFIFDPEVFVGSTEYGG